MFVQAATEPRAKAFSLDYPPLVANGGVLGIQMHPDGAVIRRQFVNDGDVGRVINAPDCGYVQCVRAKVGPVWIIGRSSRAHDRYPSRIIVPV